MLRLLSFTAALLITLSIVGAPRAAEAKYASIVIDAVTGEVLHSVNADTRNHPASLTKIMTLYMMFDAIEKKKFTFDSELKVSRKASQQRPSKLGLRKGTTIKVKDAVMALVTKSANDVAVVIAESLAKSEAEFAKKMTIKAHEMGMKNTFFKNASGLHKKGQLSSARDMATLGLRIKADFPEHYKLFKTWKYKYKNRTYYNHNKLLRYYEGTDGIKTGFTNASGFNLVASVNRHGRRLMGVVFGGKTSKSRNKHMTKILDKGFRKLMIASLRAPLRPEIIVAKNGNVNIITAPGAAVQTQIATAETIAITGETNNAIVTTNTAELPLATTVNTVSNKPTLVAVAASTPSLPMEKSSKSSEIDKIDIPSIWAVQVGAYSQKRRAQQAAGLAAVHIRYVSKTADIQISEIEDVNSKLYRARLTGLSEIEARESCHLLSTTKLSCVIVPPSQPDQIAFNK